MGCKVFVTVYGRGDNGQTCWDFYATEENVDTAVRALGAEMGMIPWATPPRTKHSQNWTFTNYSEGVIMQATAYMNWDLRTNEDGYAR